MRRVVSCPMPGCGAAFVLDPVPECPPALAQALGLPQLSLEGHWSHQSAQKLEGELHAHMLTHPPEEWLPEFTDAHRALERERDITAELRRHVESLERQLAQARPPRAATS